MMEGGCEYSQAGSIGEVIGGNQVFRLATRKFKGLIKNNFLCILPAHAPSNSLGSKAPRFPTEYVAILAIEL